MEEKVEKRIVIVHVYILLFKQILHNVIQTYSLKKGENN